MVTPPPPEIRSCLLEQTRELRLNGNGTESIDLGRPHDRLCGSLSIRLHAGARICWEYGRALSVLPEAGRVWQRRNRRRWAARRKRV